MKIYIILEGEYSDRSIVGVAESRKLAEEYIKLHTTKYHEYFEIEEWDSNSVNIQTIEDDKNGRFGYEISFYQSGGISNYQYLRIPETEVDFNRFDNIMSVYIECKEDEYDHEKLFKIARDKRSKYLSEKLGL